MPERMTTKPIQPVRLAVVLRAAWSNRTATSARPPGLGRIAFDHDHVLPRLHTGARPTTVALGKAGGAPPPAKRAAPFFRCLCRRATDDVSDGRKPFAGGRTKITLQPGASCAVTSVSYLSPRPTLAGSD